MRITHATPAAAYATSAYRNWEGNQKTPAECRDIAFQLIHGKVGRKLDVAMGGGLQFFKPTYFIDKNGNRGARTDGRDLVEEYLNFRSVDNKRPVFVENKKDLLRISPYQTDSILGLFAHSHMNYRMDTQKTEEPTLIEMVDKTIDILKKNPNGYVLLVEGI